MVEPELLERLEERAQISEPENLKKAGWVGVGMLPVISFLSGNIPAAGNKVLFYSLSVASAMGGNGSLIGASANMVTAGISERAGYTISYGYFLRKGFPALVITVGLATIWILIRF